MRAVLVALSLCAAPIASGVAQRVAASTAGATRPAAYARASGGAPQHADTARAPYEFLTRVPRSLAPVASAILPGLGQAALRQDRFVAYAALEGFLLLQYAKDVHESNLQYGQSRELALRVARKDFVSAARAPVGDWDYYERLEHYVESGKYTLVPGTIVPDTTHGSFNASVWLTARKNHWANPDKAPPVGSAAWNAAISEYAAHATRPEFQWSWLNAELEQNLYVGQINKRNDAFRHATTDLSIILANHILSMVDAFATVRLQALEGSRRVGITTTIALPGAR